MVGGWRADQVLAFYSVCVKQNAYFKIQITFTLRCYYSKSIPSVTPSLRPIKWKIRIVGFISILVCWVIDLLFMEGSILHPRKSVAKFTLTSMMQRGVTACPHYNGTGGRSNSLPGPCQNLSRLPCACPMQRTGQDCPLLSGLG